MADSSPFIAFVTTRWLTHGIEEVEVEAVTFDGNGTPVIVRSLARNERSPAMDGRQYYYRGQWAPTMEKAVEQVTRKVRARKKAIAAELAQISAAMDRLQGARDGEP